MVPENLREAFDAETAGSGGTITSGPGSAMVNSPEMRRRANALVNYLRDESTLDKRIQELAMVVTARANDCQYIWNAHAAGARRQGIPDAFVDALRDGQPLPDLAADEQAVVNLGQEFFRTRQVSQETFQAAFDQFGAQGLTELCTLFGYYALLSFNANTFMIDLPEERTEAVLPI
jgi:4-carboxymuconolactone decarboxylase